MGRRKISNRPLYPDEIRHLNRVKHEICRRIAQIAQQNRWLDKQLAIFLGVSPSTASRILRYRYDQLGITELFKHLVRLQPAFDILIALPI